MPGIDSFTKLMLHMNSDFSDSSASDHTPTVSGATIDTGVKVFGAGSGKFIAASSQYVTYPDHSDWSFGSSDFTIDTWVRFASVSAQQLFVSQWGGAGTRSFAMDISATGNPRLIYSTDGTNIFLITDSTVLSAATWYHLAVVGYSGTIKIYVAGTYTDGDATPGAALYSASQPLALGINLDGGAQAFGGNLDELRISKGIARWTSNFTPPTSEYNGAPPSGVTIFRRRIEGE